MKKGGQLKISFGMIFSIILIIAFISLAIYGILWFLEKQKVAKVGMFYQDFQDDVDSLYRGTYGSDEFVYSLPGEIEEVCIIRTQYTYEDNLKLYRVLVSVREIIVRSYIIPHAR